MAISEWNFAPSLKSDSKTAKKVAFCDTYSRDEKLFLKQLTVLEQELFSMIKLSETQRHPNIVQVNLCQKLLFLHQLTHNMTKDCSWSYQFST